MSEWLPSANWDPVLTVRRAVPADARAIARTYVDCWRRAYTGILPASYLASLSYEAFERHWKRTLSTGGWAFVAEVEGRVVGVASGGRSRRPRLGRGEIYVLYVDEGWQRRGIGRCLFDACHYELAVRRCPGLVVWVLAVNPARGFYERLGGLLADENTLEIAGVPLREVAYIWPD